MWSPSVARFWQELEIQNPLSVFCGSCWTNCPTPPKQPAAPSLVWPPSHSASTTSLARRSPTSWALSPRKTTEEKKRTRKSGSPTESPSSHPSVSLGEGQWLFVVRSLLVVCLFVCCWGGVGVGGGVEEGWILFVVKKKPVSYGEPFIWPFSEFGEREEERNVWGQKEIGLVWCPLTDWPLQWEFTCPFNLLNRALCSIYKLISLPVRMPVCVCVYPPTPCTSLPCRLSLFFSTCWLLDCCLLQVLLHMYSHLRCLLMWIVCSAAYCLDVVYDKAIKATSTQGTEHVLRDSVVDPELLALTNKWVYWWTAKQFSRSTILTF